MNMKLGPGGNQRRRSYRKNVQRRTERGHLCKEAEKVIFARRPRDALWAKDRRVDLCAKTGDEVFA